MPNWKQTGSDAMDEALNPDSALWLKSVKLHLSTVGGAVEDFTVTVDSAVGIAYDVLLLAHGMNAVTDLVWTPDQPLAIDEDDAVDFAYANSNGRTWGLEVNYETKKR